MPGGKAFGCSRGCAPGPSYQQAAKSNLTALPLAARSSKHLPAGKKRSTQTLGGAPAGDFTPRCKTQCCHLTGKAPQLPLVLLHQPREWRRSWPSSAAPSPSLPCCSEDGSEPITNGSDPTYCTTATSSVSQHVSCFAAPKGCSKQRIRESFRQWVGSKRG